MVSDMRIGAHGRYYNGTSWGCPFPDRKCCLRSLRFRKMLRHLWRAHIRLPIVQRFSKPEPLTLYRPQRPVCPVALCGSYRAEHVRGGWAATDNFRCLDCGTEWGTWL